MEVTWYGLESLTSLPFLSLVSREEGGERGTERKEGERARGKVGLGEPQYDGSSWELVPVWPERTENQRLQTREPETREPETREAETREPETRD